MFLLLFSITFPFLTIAFMVFFLWTSQGCIPTVPPQKNLAPIIRISPVSSVKVGETVQLNASESYDPEGDSISFIWHQQSGPATVNLNKSETSIAEFIPFLEGTYIFSLKISDSETSSTATIEIFVSALPFAEAPILDPPSGTIFRNSIDINISSSSQNSTIYYTLDGTLPSTTNGFRYTKPVTLSDSCILKAITIHPNMNSSEVTEGSYTRHETTDCPTFDPADKTFFQNQLEVRILCKTDGASIYYTLNGNEPNAMQGLLYTGPILLSDTCTIKAMACKDNYFDSDIISAKFTHRPTVATPEIAPLTPLFKDSCTIELSCRTPQAVIYYTTDGRSPSPDYGIRYTGPFVITTSRSIHAIACHDEMFDSEVLVAHYTRMLPVANPDFTPATGTKFEESLQISISCDTENATIRYTIDGTDPNPENGFIYTEPITITKTTQLKAMAYKYAMIDTPIVTADYTKVICGLCKWSYLTSGPIDSSPALGPDGTIYVGSSDRKLYAISQTGSLKWSYTTGNVVFSSPAVNKEGIIYVGSLNGLLYAIKSNGIPLWTYDISKPILASPAIGDDGTIYINNANGLFAISPSGSLKWHYVTTTSSSYTYSSPAIGPDGTLYVGTVDKRLHAVNPDGTCKWIFETSNYIDSSPAIDSDGTIYVGSGDHKLWAIHPDGRLKWCYKTGGYIDSSPVIGPDGTIYIGSADNRLYAIDSNGQLKWTFLTKGKIHATPTIGSDGSIYIAAMDGFIYAVNSDGNLNWSLSTGGAIESSPTIGNNSLLYVGSKDGRLYAITTISQLADTPWPKFHRNLRQAGNSNDP
jgi:outer membrane protein assembly factor BamB